MSTDPGPLDLTPLPERLAALGPSPQVAALVEAEHARWRELHDRLIGIIAAAIDVAVDHGTPLQEVLDELVDRTRVGLDALVPDRIDPAAIAALLRAHGSTGTVHETADAVEFRHECGSGLRYWRDHPATATVGDGEVEGVPAERPRYCARCMHTIAGHGGGRWTVAPPADPAEHCTWRIAR
ncbi:hypothetical protein [Pseudonocardia parietis]|jgi:hypothetical protein|uniref:CGNR zinc finger protein n=1 Tax=Pseudonocardia parietis TaxID=570936 RepID=A0ABS4VZK9_9PSEU|nr:hypothetical protein [Pseudonocardia parietis]MBP2369395.1 hypothetical protein [Pseudonocardia parietis]